MNANSLAVAFAKQVTDNLVSLYGPVQGAAYLADAVRQNREESDSSICHSHDHLDANQSMLDAFETVFGRECDLQSDDDSRLIDEAWAIAKACGFDVVEIQAAAK